MSRPWALKWENRAKQMKAAKVSANNPSQSRLNWVWQSCAKMSETAYSRDQRGANVRAASWGSARPGGSQGRGFAVELPGERDQHAERFPGVELAPLRIRQMGPDIRTFDSK